MTFSMKKYLVFLIGLLVLGFSFGQGAPEMFAYQGVARESGGLPLKSTTIFVKISLLKGSTPIYEATHEVETNEFGLYSLRIGETGSKITGVSGDFTLIDWGASPIYVKVAINGKDVGGSQQLLSVPYALYAKKAGSGSSSGGGAEITNIKIENGELIITEGTNVKKTTLANYEVLPSPTSDGYLFYNTTNQSWEVKPISGNGTDTDEQSLRVDGDSLRISNGNGVLLSDLLPQGTAADNDKVLTWNGSAWEIKALPSGSGVDTDKQNLSFNTATKELSIDRGAGVDLSSLQDGVDDADANPKNEWQSVGELKNVDTVSLALTDGNVLKWDASTKKWLPKNDDIGVGGVATLGPGQILIGDGNNNNTGLVGGDLVLTGSNFDIKDGAVDLDDLESPTGVQDGDFIVYEGGKWIFKTVTSTGNTDNQNLQDVLTEGADADTKVITNLGAPNNDNDASTKKYVDDQVTGLDIKDADADPKNELQSIGELKNVDTVSTALAEGNVLKWDSNTKKWIPGNDETGLGGVPYIGGAGINVTGTIISNTGDLDSSNEIQDLEINNDILKITDNTSASGIDLGVYKELPSGGSTGQVLTSNGTNSPTWSTISGGSNTDNQGLTITSDSIVISGGDGVALSELPKELPTVPNARAILVTNENVTTTEWYAPSGNDKLLGTNNVGALSVISVGNGLTQINTGIGLGGDLSTNTTISGGNTNGLSFIDMDHIAISSKQLRIVNPQRTATEVSFTEGTQSGKKGLLDISSNLKFTDGNEALNRVLTSDKFGNASWQQLPSNSSKWSDGDNANQIHTDNKVGIGITNPTEMLYIKGTDADVDIETNNSSASSSIHIRRSAGTSTVPAVVPANQFLGNLQFQGYTGNNYATGAIVGAIVEGASDGSIKSMPSSLYFSTNNGAGTGVDGTIERMRITSSGNVGVGTNNPNLNGATRALSIVASNSYSANKVASLELQGSDNASNSEISRLDFNSYGSSSKNIARLSVGNGTGTIGTTGYMAFLTETGSGLTEKMRITQTGNVVIGTAFGGNSQNEKLVVNGNSQTSGIILNQKVSSDVHISMLDSEISYYSISQDTEISKGNKTGQMLVLTSSVSGNVSVTLQNGSGASYTVTLSNQVKGFMFIWTGTHWAQI